MTDYDLTANEKKVLLALSTLETAEAKKVADVSGLNVDASMQAAFLLEEKGLVTIVEESFEFYCLSSEGKQYAEVGLPERQIIDSTRGPTPLEKIRSQFSPQFVNIATGWLLKKKWAKIESNMLIPSDSISEKGDDEKALFVLFKMKEEGNESVSVSELLKKSISKGTLSDLLKRKLLEKEDVSVRRVSITGIGQAVVSKGIEIKEEIAQITSELIKGGNWENKTYRPYKIQKPARSIYGAKIHPYQRLIDQMRQIFLEMGFTEIKGDIVQSSFWNFDALFQPQDHPAREMQDTFHLESRSELPEKYVGSVCKSHETGGDTGSTGWGGKWNSEIAEKNVLRTHTTAVTVKYLADHPKGPIKAFCIDRAYR
ncbi:MAG: phenylalanine--tRNA ligase subunit alpha, partial [Methanimicrococcus sp.]|nr:phenylalanine--tRNA ligase subunit alpha [Methanimicrococcus sp.]